MGRKAKTADGMVEIIMPAGVDKGKAVMVTPEQAAALASVHGEYRPDKPSADVAVLQARIAELEAELAEANAARAESRDVLLDGSPVPFGDDAEGDAEGGAE